MQKVIIWKKEREFSHTYETYSTFPGHVWVDGRKATLREGRLHYQKMVRAGFNQREIRYEESSYEKRDDYEDMEHWNKRMIERSDRRERDDPLGYG